MEIDYIGSQGRKVSKLIQAEKPDIVFLMYHSSVERKLDMETHTGKYEGDDPLRLAGARHLPHRGGLGGASLGMCLRMPMGVDVFLKEISITVGLSSANYIARTFRQVEGMSQREYQKMVRE